MPLPHEEVTKKQPRRQFRKERKRATRQRRRQLFAQARDQRVDEAQKLKQHSEHLQQKRLWEEREQRYELINAVRRKAEETERQAREAAKVEALCFIFYMESYGLFLS